MTLKEELGYGLDALVLFRGLQQNPVIHALMEFCHADSSDLANQIRTYSSIVAALYPATDNLTDYMEKIVLEEETVYVQRIGAGEAVSDAMKKCLETELHLLQKIAMLTSSQLQAEMPYFPDLPTWLPLTTNVLQTSASMAMAYMPSIICLHWTKPATLFQSVTQTRLI